MLFIAFSEHYVQIYFYVTIDRNYINMYACINYKSGFTKLDNALYYLLISVFHMTNVRTVYQCLVYFQTF